MLGLVFIFIFLIYLLISVGVIAFFVRMAKEHGIAPWKLGVPAAFVMYLIVFWDHIPTLIARNHYCEKEAGFFVYKTLDEWKKENPGIAKTLTYNNKADSEKKRNIRIYHLNERFEWHVDTNTVFLSLKRKNNKIIDVSNNEVIAQYIDFSTGWGNIGIGADTWNDFKFWLVSSSCEKGGNRKNRKQFYEFEREAAYLGRDEL